MRRERERERARERESERERERERERECARDRFSEGEIERVMEVWGGVGGGGGVQRESVG